MKIWKTSEGIRWRTKASIMSSGEERPHVKGGFFWINEKEPSIIMAPHMLVADCVFMRRPKWYEFGEWRRIFWRIIRLPH